MVNPKKCRGNRPPRVQVIKAEALKTVRSHGLVIGFF